MVVYNFTKNEMHNNIELIKSNTDIYFVVAGYNDKEKLQTIFDFHEFQENQETLDQMIRFQIYESFDFVSLLYMDLDGKEFIHSKVNLYLSKHVLVVLTDNIEWIEELLFKEIQECLDNIFIGREK
ncbi:hypothetical protein AZF37_02985 [endosymbiont 'TC1' of Trimyema compressum]|uniref:hypothetical protein n=1 Tax=endosymbiont 'TC1' of Trimyema compressum TaxID=243899 RepID=UPI0007F0EC84|nr:hypothetical protein [endosymbiont 'TC1' of Trimyema compressum]AMP20274.1 hypothetical protein AZF37_02985 [endosymbiont 'TC1' of Trimyema compressum]